MWGWARFESSPSPLFAVPVFAWRVLNVFLSGDAPRSKGNPPGCLQWGVGGSQPVREGAWLEAARGWGAQWGEGLEMCLVLSWSKVAFEEGMKYTSALDWYSTAPEF